MISTHPLITCSNPSSTGRSAPCMTIRLTPQTLAALSAQPAPAVSFCLSDRTITIAGTTHTLQAFDEDPSLCEIYRLKGSDLIQIGNINQKLIVQRDVSSSGNGNHIAKPIESSSVNSNPYSNSTYSKQTGVKRNNGSINRSNSETSLKKRVTSANTTPIRVNKSPVDMKANPSSPDRHSAPVRPSSRINSSLPLRKQILHLLAIQPMSAAGLAKRLSQTTKSLASVLKAVATYEMPGRYRAKNSLLAELHVDAWPYSPEEKTIVIKNIGQIDAAADDGNNQCDNSLDTSPESFPVAIDIRPLRIEGRSHPPKSTPKSSSVTPLHPPSTAPSVTPASTVKIPYTSTAKTTSSHQANGSTNSKTTAAPLSARSVAPIESHEQYLSYRARFEKTYPRYSAVDARLKQIAEEFNTLAAMLDSPQCPVLEKRKLQVQVKNLYSEVKPEVDQLKGEFRSMHEEMAALKSCIKAYVDSYKPDS
uniref:OCEL domain-containing protein n=1 Tax=Spongospora subterranea TaxID=70186 RepID=A0A0H5R845_9EUKA|eukprot:CRZ10288.1 hypothetical protein [Spongospora subterranea]